MNNNTPTFGVISLGCAKNTVDSERMIGLLKAAGFRLVTDPELADALIVNTCGFIEPAKQESINTILEMAEYKRGPCKLLVVTGCLSERYRSELTEALPEVDILLGVREYHKLPALMWRALGAEVLPAEGSPLCCASPRVLATPPYRAYLRVADGCDNRCSYCAIPLIRGKLSSEPIESLEAEARRLAEGGVSELSVIAQDTSGYGRELYGKPRLMELLKRLCDVDGLHRIRLLYTYPDTVTPELLDLIAGEPKLVPYLDMPLQHISDGVLTRMNRRGSSGHIRSLLDHIYKKYPDFTLRTTMMVGFPGETREDFETLMSFIGDYPFDRLGAFAFSPEEGTKACDMAEQIPEEVKAYRLDALMTKQRKISRERNTRWLGRELELLVEGRDESGLIFGRTEREAPDVDGLAFTTDSAEAKAGEYRRFRVTEAYDYDVKGELV